jgi:hypothetical protein
VGNQIEDDFDYPGIALRGPCARMAQRLAMLNRTPPSISYGETVVRQCERSPRLVGRPLAADRGTCPWWHEPSLSED